MDWIVESLIFGGGVVLGFLLNKFIGFIFNKYLKKFREQKSAKRAKKLKNKNNGENFNFANLSVNIYIFDVDVRGYKRKNIIFSKEERFLKKNKERTDIPANHKVKYNKYYEQNIKELETGKFWDHNDTLGLRSINISRENEAEEFHVFNLNATIGSYCNHLSTMQTWTDLSDKCKNKINLENKYLPDPFFSTLCAVTLAIITTDKKIMFHRRGVKSIKDPGSLMCGIGEGLKAGDLKQDTPAPFHACWRALREECGITLTNHEKDNIILNSLVFNVRLNEWYFTGYIDFRENDEHQLNSEDIKNSIRSSMEAKDRFEFDIEGIQFIDFEPEALASFLYKNEKDFVEYGIPVAIYSLLAIENYNWENLERRFEKQRRKIKKNSIIF